MVARKRRDGWLDTRCQKRWKDWDTLTFEQRAERLGMSRANYIRLSDGDTKPSVPTMARLAAIFKTTLDQICRDTDQVT